MITVVPGASPPASAISLPSMKATCTGRRRATLPSSTKTLARSPSASTTAPAGMRVSCAPSPRGCSARLATRPLASATSAGASRTSIGNRPVAGSAPRPSSLTVPASTRPGSASIRTCTASPAWICSSSRSATAARTTQPRAAEPTTSTGCPAGTSSCSSARRCSTTPSAGARMRAWPRLKRAARSCAAATPRCVRRFCSCSRLSTWSACSRSPRSSSRAALASSSPACASCASISVGSISASSSPRRTASPVSTAKRRTTPPTLKVSRSSSRYATTPCRRAAGKAGPRVAGATRTGVAGTVAGGLLRWQAARSDSASSAGNAWGLMACLPSAAPRRRRARARARRRAAAARSGSG